MAGAALALAEQPLLGWVSLDDGAAGGGSVPDLATARALTERARFAAEGRRGSQAKDGPHCGGHALTCAASDSVTFEVAQLLLEPGERLTSLDLELVDDLGQPVAGLDGDTVARRQLPLGVDDNYFCA